MTGSDFCYDVPQGPVKVGGETVFTKYLLGVTPVCKFDSSNADLSAFNVLDSFSYPDELKIGFGPFLTGVFLLSLSLSQSTSRRRPIRGPSSLTTYPPIVARGTTESNACSGL